MMDTDHHGGGSAADEAEAAFFARRSRRCCCFPWPAPSASAHQRVGGGGGAAATAAAVGEEESWWQSAVDAVLKLREWSELVAGPRWKTFIRRFGRNGPQARPHHHFGGGRKLNYDALSYALNFDEGHGASPEGDYTGYRDFSARFVIPPQSAKSSMDLGGRDAPPLFNPPTAHDGVGRA